MLLRRVISVVLWGGLFAYAQSVQSNTGLGDAAAKQFTVGPSTILMPQGFFLLIRKGHQVGAIRFTQIEQGGTVGVGKAAYESYFQGDGSTSLNVRSARKKTGETDLKPLTGIGRFSFQSGKDKLQVGDWIFGTAYPGRINMWSYRGSQKDYGYEFAPTSAHDVGEIDASDKRLRWFRFDKDSRVTLQVSDLPK